MLAETVNSREHPKPEGEIKLSGKLIDEVLNLCDENLFGCYQCGTCAAGCPFVEEMDLTPDEVIRYVIMDKKEVLNQRLSGYVLHVTHVPRGVRGTSTSPK